MDVWLFQFIPCWEFIYLTSGIFSQRFWLQEQHGTDLLQPLAFIISVRQLQDKLAASYASLGDFLFAKSNLFDVDMTPASYQQSMIDLSLENGKLITILMILKPPF